MFFKNLKKQVENHPDKTAVQDSERELTYRQLWDELSEKREIACSRGIDKDSKILLQMNNSCDWITNVLAFMAVGAKTVMISPDSTDAQIQYLDSELHFDEILTEDNCASFFAHNEPASLNREFELPDSRTEVVYHVTSGSTGEVKICIRTLAQFQAEGQMYQERLGLDEQDVVVCPLPLYHSFAFGAAFISSLRCGAALVLLKRFTPRNYLQTIIQKKATVSFIVPVMARMLTKCKLDTNTGIECLRYLVVGAGVINEELFSDFQNRFGIVLSANYGSSETGGIITRVDAESFPSIGLPMDGVVVEIRGETGEKLKPGTEGEIWVKAKSMMNRYYHKKEVYDERGYFFTGDLARVDNKGNVYITGRVKNIINIGGKKVNAVYVENILKTHPAIQDAVVIGKKRLDGEEGLVSVITVCEEIEVKDIYQFLQDKIEQYMIPTVIRILDKIPKNNMGKVQYEEVMKCMY